MPVAAPMGVRSHGRTKNGAIIHAARRTPNTMGSVRQPPRRSPSISLKSFVDAAPRRKKPKIAPMNHGSATVARAAPRAHAAQATRRRRRGGGGAGGAGGGGGGGGTGPGRR